LPGALRGGGLVAEVEGIGKVNAGAGRRDS